MFLCSFELQRIGKFAARYVRRAFPRIAEGARNAGVATLAARVSGAGVGAPASPSVFRAS